MKTLFNPRILLFLALALSFNVCTIEEVILYGSISGVVRDTQSKQPLEGVSVTLKPGGITKVTGKDGSYTFNELDAKEYTLTYTKDKYLSASKETSVQAGVNNVVDITLDLEPIVPILEVSTQSLDFGSELTTLSLYISNKGKGTLSWSIEHPSSWFTCSPKAGATTTERSSVVVTVTRNQIEKGSHQKTFSITSNGGSLDITVTMTVSGANMTIAPAELNFGTLDTERNLTLTNNGTLAIDYTVTTSNTWIILGKTSGKLTSTDNLKVMVSRESLSPADYNGGIIIHVSGEEFGVPVKMSVAANDKPSVRVEQPKNITHNSATFSGVIESVGKDRVTRYGFCWSTSPEPTLNNSFSDLGDSSIPTAFESVVSDLQPSTQYYVRAYAQNSAGVSYSASEPSFTTAEQQSTVPTVSTGTVSDITTSTATVSGVVSDLGNMAGVTQYGHVWSTSPSPSVNLSTRTTLGALYQIDSYTSSLTNLFPNTTYYVRSYATNVVGTAYGNELSFTTPASSPIVVPVTGVSLDQTSLSGHVGASATLTATVSPSNATNKNVTWSTDNPSVATVSDGVVSFVGEGNATITVTTENGNRTATCYVTVTIPVTSVSLNQTSLSLELNGTVQLTATVYPTNATNQAVSWSSSNTSVATVSSGLVTVHSAGTTHITVTTADGNKTATCVVNVTTAGTVGPLSWRLENGVLTISGTGAIPQYSNSYSSRPPWAGYSANITAIVIEDGVTSIGPYAFYSYSSLQSVTIGNTVTSIGTYAFYGSSLTSATLGNSVTNIGDMAFYECNSLASINIPNSVTNIGSQVFYNCNSLASITIPNSVTSIGSSAFSGCYSLISVTIPNSVTSIGESTFSGCYSLTSITIPNSVTSIGWSAFDGCSSLRNVVVLRTSPPSINNSTFQNVSLSSATLTVPNGCKPAYQNAAVWQDFGTIVEAN
jgi:uncharacterized protein YjdB